MLIKSSTALRNEYNDIATFCKEKRQPVFLTKNGEGDLVVMSIDAFERREELYRLRAKLEAAEAGRLAGVPTYSVDEVFDGLEEIYRAERAV